MVEQLQGVVQAEGVAAGQADHRLQSLPADPVGEGEARRPCRHPGPVALDRVDLAVVGQEPERLRQGPGREGVGAVALVEERNCALVGRVPQVGVEPIQILRQHEPLVDHGTGGAGDDEALPRLAGRGGTLERLARQHQVPLERLRVSPGRLPHQKLGDAGPGRRRRGAEHARVGRHLAPADHRQPLSCHRRFKQPPAPPGPRLVPGQERHRHAHLPGRGSGVAEAGEVRGKERVGHLGHDPGAVPGPRIGPDAPAVREVDEPRQGARHDLAGRAAVDIDH